MNLISGIIFGSLCGIYFAGIYKNVDLVMIYGAIFTAISMVKLIDYFIKKKEFPGRDFYIGVFLCIIPMILRRMEGYYNYFFCDSS